VQLLRWTRRLGLEFGFLILDLVGDFNDCGVSKVIVQLGKPSQGRRAIRDFTIVVTFACVHTPVRHSSHDVGVAFSGLQHPHYSGHFVASSTVQERVRRPATRAQYVHRF
jgi:hypothetical protein